MITVKFTKREILYSIADIISDLKTNYFAWCVSLMNALQGKEDGDEIVVQLPGELLTKVALWREAGARAATGN